MKIVFDITWRLMKYEVMKYIKVYIFRKEVSQGIYLYRQIFGCFFFFLKNRQKGDFFGPESFNKGKKKYFGQK